jgi:hypothetical protein
MVNIYASQKVLNIEPRARFSMKTESFRAYLSGAVADKKREILGEEYSWDGRKGIYFVEGTYGTNVHVVYVRKEDSELNVFCSCAGFLRGGICAHVAVVLGRIVALDESMKELVEKWLKERREKK